MPTEALPQTLVVDASVGLKWVVDEADSDEAVALVAGRRLIAPALFWIETANALAVKTRRGELTRAAAADAWRDLCEAPIEIVPVTPGSVTPALTLAQDLPHTVYDCAYLATALSSGCSLVTADARFAAILSAHPFLADKVRLLRDL